MTDKPSRSPSPLGIDRVPLRAASLANGSIVRFDTFAIDSTIFPERKEQPEGGTFELYDAMRFLEVVFNRPPGRQRTLRQVRWVPWAQVAQVIPFEVEPTESDKADKS